ncbi:MAG: ferritin family protein [Actinomycetes bacterium]
MADLPDFFTANLEVAAATELDVDTMWKVFRLERTGHEFYEQLAARVDHPGAQDLLRRNGKEELAHARRILKAIALTLGHEVEPTEEQLELHPVPLPDTVDASLLGLVVAGERNADAGYQSWADQMDDPEVAKLLRLNGREETIHGERVDRAIALMSVAD